MAMSLNTTQPEEIPLEESHHPNKSGSPEIQLANRCKEDLNILLLLAGLLSPAITSLYIYVQPPIKQANSEQNTKPSRYLFASRVLLTICFSVVLLTGWGAIILKVRLDDCFSVDLQRPNDPSGLEVGPNSGNNEKKWLGTQRIHFLTLRLLSTLGFIMGMFFVAVLLFTRDWY